MPRSGPQSSRIQGFSSRGTLPELLVEADRASDRRRAECRRRRMRATASIQVGSTRSIVRSPPVVRTVEWQPRVEDSFPARRSRARCGTASANRSSHVGSRPAPSGRSGRRSRSRSSNGRPVLDGDDEEDVGGRLAGDEVHQLTQRPCPSPVSRGHAGGAKAAPGSRSASRRRGSRPPRAPRPCACAVPRAARDDRARVAHPPALRRRPARR